MAAQRSAEDKFLRRSAGIPSDVALQIKHLWSCRDGQAFETSLLGLGWIEKVHRISADLHPTNRVSTAQVRMKTCLAICPASLIKRAV